MANRDRAMETLRPQPGQTDSYTPKFKPLPGERAKQQLEGNVSSPSRAVPDKMTPLQKALAAERAQHEYWENWQGVHPAKPEYNNPREWLPTLQPSASYGTEGRGSG